jgi:hypothetical protein
MASMTGMTPAIEVLSTFISVEVENLLVAAFKSCVIVDGWRERCFQL